MLSISNTNDSKKLYQVCWKVLMEKATNSGITKTQLDDYFIPMNKAHKDYYANLYGLSKPLNLSGKDLYFMRFVHSIFNSGYHNDITKNPVIFNEIAKITESFNLTLFLSIVKSADDLLNKVMKSTTVLKNNNHSRIKNDTKSIFEVAQYLENIPILDKVVYPPIYNMGLALFADAVKESGILDIAKPDTHIIDVLNKAYGKNFKKNNTQKMNNDIQKMMKQIADDNNVTVYKLDKIIWMASANVESTFYLHNAMTYKQKLLNLLP